VGKRLLLANCLRHLSGRQIQALVGTLAMVATAVPVLANCVEQFH
jgi:hypothetical protein